LWYQANFILGNISEKQFLKQPEKLRLESRLILAKALKAEYKKEEGKAIQYYAAYKALPSFKKALFPVIDAFVEWRSAALSKSGNVNSNKAVLLSGSREKNGLGHEKR